MIASHPLAAALLAFAALALPQGAPTPAAAPAVPAAPAAPAAQAAARAVATIESAKLTADDLAGHDDEWTFEEKLACRSNAAKQLWEGTLIDAALGAPKKKEFQTIGVGLESDTLLYFEFEGDVPPAWRKQLNEKLWSATGAPTFAQPEIVGQSGKLVVVLSCSLTSKIRKPVGHRLRTKFGMRFPDQEPAHLKLYGPLESALQKEKPDPSGMEFWKAHEKELSALSYGAFLEARLRAGNEEHELAAKAYARALELDRAGDPLPGDGAACDALHGIGMASYKLKKWPEAIAAMHAAVDYATSIFRADRQTDALYDLACCCALGDKPDDAMKALADACAVGGRKIKTQAKADDDFKSLRERDDWKALVK